LDLTRLMLEFGIEFSSNEYDNEGDPYRWLAFGASFALIVQSFMRGTQTAISRWSEMHHARSYRRHVPIIRPREWREW